MEVSVSIATKPATNSDENEDENWSDINTDEDDDNGLSNFYVWILHMIYHSCYFQIAH